MTTQINSNGNSDYVDQNRHLNASYKIISILRQSKTSIEKIIDDLPDIFGILDLQGHIVKGNHSLSKIAGLNIEQLLGYHLKELFSDENWDVFSKNIEELTVQKSIEFELPIKADKESGSQKIYIWKIKRISTKNTQSSQLFFLLGSDVTILRDRETKLKNLTERLQDLVNEKTKDITSLLDSIDQGLFSVAPDMTLNNVHSKQAEIIFDTNQFGGRTIKELLKISDKKAKEFQDWYSLASSPRGLRRWKKYMMLCPIQQLNIDNRIVKFEYRPILDNNDFKQLLVLTTDVTENVKNQEKIAKVEKVQALQTERIMGLVKNLSISISMFFDETRSYLATINGISNQKDIEDQVRELFNILHTLKGNSGSFGFHNLASIAGDMEDICEQIVHDRIEEPEDIWPNWTKWTADLNLELEELEKLRQMLFSGSDDAIPVNKKLYQKLLSALEKKETTNDIYAMALDLDSHPLDEHCQKYNNIIKLYREKYQKNIKDLNVTTPNFLMRTTTMADMDTAMIHLVRNAVDHGIESNEERQEKNKGPGEIKISCEKRDGFITLKISDNGGGIDPDKIAQSALKKGVISSQEMDKMNADEKINLIFHQGLSTKEEVTSISGRGVGLDAVLSSIKEKGGDLHLNSVLNQGTTFIIKLPE